MTLKDYAREYVPAWYNLEVRFPKFDSVVLKLSWREDILQRVNSIWEHMDEVYHGYKSYYLAVAYRQHGEKYLLFDGTYFNVPGDDKAWLLKIMKFYLSLPVGCMSDDEKASEYGCVNVYDFNYFVEAYKKGDLIL